MTSILRSLFFILRSLFSILYSLLSHLYLYPPFSIFQATGSGTGTPATGASSATLATLRDRIRVQIEAATGRTEPLVVTGSSETLTTLRDRVETSLQDTGNAIWASGDIDEAIEKAIEQYSRRNPDHARATINLSANGREIDISSITNLLRVEKVWWDYDSSSPGHPPNWRQFNVWPGSILYIDDDDEPQSGDVVRIWYTLPQTLNGLNAATATTIPAEDITYIINGAAGIAAQQRAIELAESLNVDKDVTKRLMDWADQQLKAFRSGSRMRPPAWQRYAFGYTQDDLDEAIRWALHRYSLVDPDRTTTTITLASGGREIDISSITDYVNIERIWWDYDSSDPGHPPKWRDFELWPGDVVYVNDHEEPASGDAVRIWYTRLHAINGLDGASTTTLPFDAETIITIGAAGFAAQERVQEQEGSRVPTKLREWAHARLKEFETLLQRIASREAAKHSGIAPGPDLDRWANENVGWY